MAIPIVLEQLREIDASTGCLVGIENLKLAVALHRFLHRLNTENQSSACLTSATTVPDFVLLRYLGRRFIATQRCQCHFGHENSLSDYALFSLSCRCSCIRSRGQDCEAKHSLIQLPEFSEPILTTRRRRCEPLAGKSTLNRLEHTLAGRCSRYHRITHVPSALKRCWSIASSRRTSRRPPRHAISGEASYARAELLQM
jgi:hypothetical protein